MDTEALKQEIIRLKQEKKAVIFAHYYQDDDIQQVADVIGDSLALARKAAETDSQTIVLCGVHFMGETAAILCPDKKVLVPDPAAGCSLADSCQADDLKRFIEAHPGHTVISYVNTSAAVKALTDVVVTSSNAVRIVNSFPKDEKIIFGPDRNLGAWINRLTGRQMLLWDGGCHVHESFSLPRILELRKRYPEALLIAHPECKAEITDLADSVGSTADLIRFVETDPARSFIVATEAGVLFEMKRRCPEKTFIPAPARDDAPCALCDHMRLCTPEKLYRCLLDGEPEIRVDAELAGKALRPIRRMLELSK